MVESPDASAGDDRNVGGTGCLQETVCVRADEHAVPGDVSDDECRSRGEVTEDVQKLLPRGFRPAVGGNDTGAVVETHRHGNDPCDSPHQRRVGDCRRTHDDPRHPDGREFLGVADRAHAAADLEHRAAPQGGRDISDHRTIGADTGLCGIEVDHVHPGGAGVDECPCHGNRIIAVNRFVGIVTLSETHDVPATHVDCGIHDEVGGLSHGRPRTKQRSSRESAGHRPPTSRDGTAWQPGCRDALPRSVRRRSRTKR